MSTGSNPQHKLAEFKIDKTQTKTLNPLTVIITESEKFVKEEKKLDPVWTQPELRVLTKAEQ